ARRIEKILATPGNAMQQATILACGDFLIGPFRLSRSEISRNSDDTAQLGIEPLNAIQIDLSQPFRSDLAFPNPGGQAGYRRERDLIVVLRQRTRIAIAPDELVALRDCLLSG